MKSGPALFRSSEKELYNVTPQYIKWTMSNFFFGKFRWPKRVIIKWICIPYTFFYLYRYQASKSVSVHFLMTSLMFMYDILRGLFIFVIGEVSSAIPKLN